MTWEPYNFSIGGLSNYVPETMISTDEVAELVRDSGYGFTAEEVERFKMEYHLKQVPIERDKSLEEMITEACSPLMEKILLEGNPIDKLLLIRTSQVSRHEQNLFQSVINQYQLFGIPCFELTQHNCASFHLGLRMVHYMFVNEPCISGIMIVTVDKAFHHSLRKLFDSINGDSASAVYLRRGPFRHRICHVSNIVDAHTYDGVNSSPELIHAFNRSYYFAIRQAINGALIGYGISLSDIKLIIGSNVNSLTWDKMSEILNLPREIFFTEAIERVGHLYCSDIPYNLSCVLEKGILSEGDYYLTVSIGLGAVFSCSLHQC